MLTLKSHSASVSSFFTPAPGKLPSLLLSLGISNQQKQLHASYKADFFHEVSFIFWLLFMAISSFVQRCHTKSLCVLVIQLGHRSEGSDFTDFQLCSFQRLACPGTSFPRTKTCMDSKTKMVFFERIGGEPCWGKNRQEMGRLLRRGSILASSRLKPWQSLAGKAHVMLHNFLYPCVFWCKGHSPVQSLVYELKTWPQRKDFPLKTSEFLKTCEIKQWCHDHLMHPCLVAGLGKPNEHFIKGNKAPTMDLQRATF